MLERKNDLGLLKYNSPAQSPLCEISI